MTPLEQSCSDIIMKNMEYRDWIPLYLLYDTESPLAKILSDAYISVLNAMKHEQMLHSSVWQEQYQDFIIREFKNPPQPLYRGGLINPDNPHAEKQNRIITAHNIAENKRTGLNHHEVLEVQLGTQSSLEIKNQKHGLIHASSWQELQEQVDPQIESIKDALISLPKWSIVILVQSTNFRLSTFRIRLELFHRGIHVVEFNHLAYIQENEYETFIDSLQYRTPEYLRKEKIFAELIQKNNEQYTDLDLSSAPGSGNLGTTRIVSQDGGILTFWVLERIRGNTWDYSSLENKGWTFPIGEVFTESVDLSNVHGRCLIESYPREDFSVEHCDPFELTIEHWRVLPSSGFPEAFQKLYDWIIEFEGEVMVRELGMGINPVLTTSTPLSDINFYERKTGVHLSLGKKHGIYGKKLPKNEMQRFHIDVFIALESVSIGEQRVFEKGTWII